MSWWQPGQLCAYSVFYGKAIVNLHCMGNQLCACSGGPLLCAYGMLYTGR